MPKDVKLWVINLIEASPLSKKRILAMLDMNQVKYFRWTHKYYLDNCLDDKRGRYHRQQPRVTDKYRKQVIEARKNKFLGKAVIGSERIMDELEKENIFLSHETIRKILLQEGLIIPRPKTETHSYHRFEAEHVNQMWQIDILYLGIIGYGYYYLISVMDDYSRRILHWQLGSRATAVDAIEAIQGAMDNTRAIPSSVLTDRGIQFYSGEGKKYGKFESFLKLQGIQHKLARVRHPQTLGKIERYHRSLRQECTNHYQFDDPIEARQIIREYIQNYNQFRRHKGIGRVTPYERYFGLDKEIRINRLKLRNSIVQFRKAGLSEEDIQKEIALTETIAHVKNVFKKEVVLM